MIKFEHTQVVGWEPAIRGMRNAYNSWDKSDTKTTNQIEIGYEDLKLMKSLRNAGTDHRKYLRMVVVYVDIIAPLYWWKEFDTYKVGTVANSCSTMHTIANKEFTLDDFSCEHLSKENIGVNGAIETSAIETLQTLIEVLNYYRKCYNEDGKTKDDWWQLIQLLPSSYNQRRTIMLNYEVLNNIYNSRCGHKLDEWRVGFMNWIKTLPYAKFITEV